MADLTVARRARIVARVPLLAGAAIVTIALALVAIAAIVTAPPTASAPKGPDAFAMSAALQRTIPTANGETKLLLATPAYLRATRQEQLGREYGAARDLVLLLTEDAHVGQLGAPVSPLLRIDDRVLVPARLDVVMDAVHHRASVLVYRDDAPLVRASLGSVEAFLPGADARAVRWERPFAEAESPGIPLSAPALLALFGGLLASMWPCLFQLSAYFLPSVAGVSLAGAQGGASKLPVIRTAILFVSGIVIVYTAAGAAAGYAAQSLGGSSLFQDAQRPLSFLAGLVVLVMAVRIAVMARAPLVCKMPVLGMAGRFGSGPLGTVLLGLAFATGCMTCFGAALVLGMFSYVVTTASPLSGAAILFLFSLGIAVPLVIASAAMARVLPLLGHLERNARYLSLASAAIMGVYAVLLLSGSSHVLSDAAAMVLQR